MNHTLKSRVATMFKVTQVKFQKFYWRRPEHFIIINNLVFNSYNITLEWSNYLELVSYYISKMFQKIACSLN